MAATARRRPVRSTLRSVRTIFCVECEATEVDDDRATTTIVVYRNDRSLRPAIPGFRERQRADALAGGRADRVGDRADRRRQRGFAETGGEVVRCEEVHVDLRRRLRDARRLVLV